MGKDHMVLLCFTIPRMVQHGPAQFKKNISTVYRLPGLEGLFFFSFHYNFGLSLRKNFLSVTNMTFFSGCSDIFYLSLVLSSLIIICLSVVFFMLFVLRLYWASCIYGTRVFSKSEGIGDIISSNGLSVPTSWSTPPRNPN